MRSMVEGPFQLPKNPSTALRAVPLPRKGGGGFRGTAADRSSGQARTIVRGFDPPYTVTPDLIRGP